MVLDVVEAATLAGAVASLSQLAKKLKQIASKKLWVNVFFIVFFLKLERLYKTGAKGYEILC